MLKCQTVQFLKAINCILLSFKILFFPGLCRAPVNHLYRYQTLLYADSKHVSYSHPLIRPPSISRTGPSSSPDHPPVATIHTCATMLTVQHAHVRTPLVLVSTRVPTHARSWRRRGRRMWPTRASILVGGDAHGHEPVLHVGVPESFLIDLDHVTCPCPCYKTLNQQRWSSPLRLALQYTALPRRETLCLFCSFSQQAPPPPLTVATAS